MGFKIGPNREPLEPKPPSGELEVKKTIWNHRVGKLVSIPASFSSILQISSKLFKGFDFSKVLDIKAFVVDVKKSLTTSVATHNKHLKRLNISRNIPKLITNTQVETQSADEHSVNKIDTSATPQFLKVLEKVNNKAAIKLRSRGNTATAPVFLTAVNEGEKRVKACDIVAIYKFVKEGVPGWLRRLEITLKSTKIGVEVLGLRRPTTLLPGQAAESKGFAEKLAYDLSEFFNFKVVPETQWVQMKGDKTLEPVRQNLGQSSQLGTVQIFADKDYKMAKEWTPQDRKQGLVVDMDGKQPSPGIIKMHKPQLVFNGEPYTEQGLIEFQKSAVMNYLMGGLDCHEGNYLLKKKDGKYDGCVLIDNGNSFFEEFPKETDRLILKNQYGWGDHPLSAMKLHPRVIEMMSEELTPEKLVAFMDKKKQEMSGLVNQKGSDHAEVFFSDKMINNTLLRLNVLRKAASEQTSLRALSSIKTFSQTQDYLTQALG